MIRKESFGWVKGKEVFLYHLSNNKGDVLSISNYGGIITSWTAADRQGQRQNITIGFKSLDRYLPNDPNFGALVGRYANRIARGHFNIDGKGYQLGLNEGRNQLHGGSDNFTKAIWDAVADEDYNTLILTLESPDGNEGYPGNLKVRISFQLSEDNGITIHYEAVTDKATYINLTCHPYFNLSGDLSRTVLDQELLIRAAAFTPVDGEGIPTGELKAVNGTPFDFTTPKAIGTAIEATGGYDHNYVLDHKPGEVALAALLSDPYSGRKLEVYTDQPGLQLYTGNGLTLSIITDDGIPLQPYAAVCLETQHFPDAPNNDNFPSTLLRPGEVFQSTTRYEVGLIS